MTKDFLKVIFVLEAGIGKPIPKEMIEVWYQVLRDIDLRILKAAVISFLSTNEYPTIPAVGLIRRLAIELRDGLKSSPEDAFRKLRSAIGKFGYSQPDEAEVFLGPQIWSVVEGTGGWIRYCDSPVEQRSSLFAQFRDGWNNVSESSMRMAQIPEYARPRTGEPAPLEMLELEGESVVKLS